MTNLEDRAQEDEQMDSETTMPNLTTKLVTHTQCGLNLYMLDGKTYIDQSSEQLSFQQQRFSENISSYYNQNKPTIIINDHKNDIQMTDDADKNFPTTSIQCQNFENWTRHFQKRRNTDDHIDNENVAKKLKLHV